jgi:hypothetical protein
LISKAKKQKVSSRLLSRTLKKAQIPPNARTLALDEMQKQLRDENKAYYNIKGEEKEL